MTIRAALFDFGGVITTSPFEAFARYEERRGLPRGFIRRVNATNPDTNAWALLERGEISLEEFGQRFLRESGELGHPVDGRDVVALLGGELRPSMVEAVRRCRGRLRTGLLTNNFIARASPPGASGGFGWVLGLFDEVVESSQIGARKPDRRFYEVACERLEIEPSEAVFLDDLGINLKPARAMGMTTIKVSDGAGAIAELEAVLGFPLG